MAGFQEVPPDLVIVRMKQMDARDMAAASDSAITDCEDRNASDSWRCSDGQFWVGRHIWIARELPVASDCMWPKAEVYGGRRQCL